MNNRIRSRVVLVAALVLIVGLGVAVAFAENIDPFDTGDQFAYGENVGWLNAEPANCGGCGVQVNTSDLTGYMYGENIGWINMSCQNNSTCGTVNYGVTKDPSGSLAGYAYGENVGWISFSCQNNPSTCASTGNYGVSIDPPTGVFSGFAYGENIGWISFSDTSPVAYQVQTEADSDSDGILDSIDADDDNDGVNDVDEGPCGSDPLNALSRPERLDGVFAGVDDDLDGPADEALPGGSAALDCDGDGFTGNDEDYLYSESSPDHDQDPCGDGTGLGPDGSNNGWAADLDNNGSLGGGDLNGFLFPTQADDGHGIFNKFAHPVSDGADTQRWDLDGNGTIGGGDLNALNPAVLAPSARPPMLDGQIGFGQACPWP